MALAPLVLSSIGPATSGAATIGGTPSDVVSSIAGHWRCTSSSGGVTHRSYVVTDGAAVMSGAATSAGTRAVGGARSSVDTPGAAGSTASVARTVYGRLDTVDTGPVFERIVEHSDRTLTAETPEGTASAAAADASSIRFAGQQTIARIAPVSENAADAGWRAPASQLTPNVSPLSLSYTVEPGGLRRIMRSGSTTLADDRCAREREVAASSVCSNPNAPVTAAHSVAPRSVSGAMQQQAAAVQMRLVIDDRGQVVGHDVISSPSAALAQSAFAAARDSTFTAALANCRAISSQYTFSAQFTNEAPRAPLSNGRETNL